MFIGRNMKIDTQFTGDKLTLAQDMFLAFESVNAIMYFHSAEIFFSNSEELLS
jgi:hypothetical protein